MEERDKLKEDLNQKRKEAWDFEYKLKQHLEDKASIEGTDAPGHNSRRASIDASQPDKASNGEFVNTNVFRFIKATVDRDE